MDVASIRPGSGGWVIVCGPSGAGKDALLRWLAGRLRDDVAAARQLAIARRIITRAVHDSSPHLQQTDTQFAALLAAGGLVMHWSAHGVRYGIPATYVDDVARGGWVVVNGSRVHARALRMQSPLLPLRIVLVTAPASVLAQRLAQRGREDERGVQTRIARNAREDVALRADCVIDNGGALADAGQQLFDYLIRLTAPALASSRSSGSQ